MKHFAVIAKTNPPKAFNLGEKKFISGSWAISKDRADSLIGCTFSVHDTQDSESYHQGEIIAVQDSKDFEGRFDVVYQWKKDKVSGKKFNWGNEKAFG